MKMSGFIVLFLLLFSCQEETQFSVQPELQSYVDEFFFQAKIHGLLIEKKNLIVKSSTDIGVNSGMCTTHSGQRTANIAQYIVSADSENPLRTKIVVFHELGHALLFRGHVDTRKSIMNTSACSNCEIDEEYLNELFHNR